MLIIFLFAASCITESLMGMPAFARKYKMSCSVCHSPFPRLKDFGEEFAGNGFVLKDKEAPRDYTDTGDDTLTLFRNLPIALRIEGHLFYNNSYSQKVDFASPYIVKLLSGGSIAKNISYYFYFFFSERGKVVGLEDAFIMFTNLFKSGISLSVGQFQVSDPLFKRELRLSFEDFYIYKAKPGASRIDLTYDRGLMFTFGINKGPDFTLEILNGSGIEEADELKNFDTDKYKNIFGRITQDIGEHFRLGACAYYGKEEGLDFNAGNVNEVRMLGADASISFPNVELNLQYVERRDDNPMFLLNETKIKTRGGFAELIYTPKGDQSRWYATGLFNWIKSDEPELDYRSFSTHLGLLLRRNIRLVGEFTYIMKSNLGEYARAGVGLITAF